MIQRLLALALLLCLVPASASVQSFREAAKTEAVRLTATQRPAARGRNPYATHSLVLVGTGGTLMLMAAILPPGLDCGADFFEPRRETGHTGLMLTGLAAAGLGLAFYLQGERRRSPNIVAIPGGVFVGQRFELRRGGRR
jgi:hypothetical protein